MSGLASIPEENENPSEQTGLNIDEAYLQMLNQVPKEQPKWHKYLSQELIFKFGSDIFLIYTMSLFLSIPLYTLYLLAHLYISGYFYYTLHSSNPGYLDTPQLHSKITQKYSQLTHLYSQELQHQGTPFLITVCV